MLAFILFVTLGFGGGVWASLLSDNFHDFFTEYIPFGEEVVLYFEEREFRKRFPNALNATHRRPAEMGEKISIPTRSGLSSKVAEPSGSDLSAKGPHMSAVGSSSKDGHELSPTSSAVSAASAAKQGLKNALGVEGSQAKLNEEPQKPKAEQSRSTKSEPVKAEPVKAEPATKKSGKPAKATETQESQRPVKKTPAVDEPSVYVPLTRLDPLNIKDANEPLVQDLVKMLNDIITVVNADNATGKFNTTIAKAKSELSAVGQKIKDLEAAEKKVADERVNATRVEFDQAARELVSRLEGEMESQESQWRTQIETEKQRLSQDYRDRLATEMDQVTKLFEEKARNQLLEQAVELKKNFSSNIKARVEHERNGRLGQLSELSASHKQLEKLTADWNSILEMNLKTQHLQVAVEAVRVGLERTDRPRPFVRELAALKELAEDDGVVNSAIASINPTAYQLGVPTSAQLIDRFRRVADEVRKASLLPDNAGVASHAASFFLSKMMFKKQGITVGNDVESVLTRAETLLDEGNLDQAAREVNTLDGWAKTLSKDWLADVRRVLEVRQALDVRSNDLALSFR